MYIGLYYDLDTEESGTVNYNHTLQVDPGSRRAWSVEQSQLIYFARPIIKKRAYFLEADLGGHGTKPRQI